MLAARTDVNAARPLRLVQCVRRAAYVFAGHVCAELLPPLREKIGRQRQKSNPLSSEEVGPVVPITWNREGYFGPDHGTIPPNPVQIDMMLEKNEYAEGGNDKG